MPWPPSCPTRPSGAAVQCRAASAGARQASCRSVTPRLVGPGAPHRRSSPRCRCTAPAAAPEAAGPPPPPPPPAGAQGGVGRDAARHGKRGEHPVCASERQRPVLAASTSATAAWNPAQISARSAFGQPALRGDQPSRARSTAVLRPGKGHVATRPVQQRAREGEPRRIALLRPRPRPTGRRAAAGPEAARPCRRPRPARRRWCRQAGEGVPVIDAQDLAMPARDQQQQVGKPRPVRQARRQGVTGQVVDPDQRLAEPHRQPLGRHDARQHAADQARPRRHGDRIDGSERDPALSSAPPPRGPASRHGRGRRSRGRHRRSAACRSACPITTEDRISGAPPDPRNTAAAVSSQLDSRPRMVTSLVKDGGAPMRCQAVGGR
jgi:hypothetical protein